MGAPPVAPHHNQTQLTPMPVRELSQSNLPQGVLMVFLWLTLCSNGVIIYYYSLGVIDAKHRNTVNTPIGHPTDTIPPEF